MKSSSITRYRTYISSKETLLGGASASKEGGRDNGSQRQADFPSERPNEGREVIPQRSESNFGISTWIQLEKRLIAC